MRTQSIVLAASLAMSGLACGGEDIYVIPGAGGPGAGDNAPSSTTPAAEGSFTSASKISAFLDGKTLVMEGAAIPTHPNGLDQDVNFGQATQCYKSVTMAPLAGRYRVTSQLGTLNGAPNTGDRGECDRAVLSGELGFDSTAALIENVEGDGACFDFTITYPGFGQEGRGRLEGGGTKLVLELFFKDQATGHRCADGDVGDRTVTLNQESFTGDAKQIYSILE